MREAVSGQHHHLTDGKTETLRGLMLLEFVVRPFPSVLNLLVLSAWVPSFSLDLPEVTVSPPLMGSVEGMTLPQQPDPAGSLPACQGWWGAGPPPGPHGLLGRHLAHPTHCTTTSWEPPPGQVSGTGVPAPASLTIDTPD